MTEESGGPPTGETGLSYEHYFDATPGIISVQDRDLRIVDSNSRLKELFGDPSNARCYEFFKRRSEPCPDCPVQETFRTGRRTKSESVVVKRDDEEMPVMVFTSPIKNENGEVVRVLKLAADITDVKKLQKRLFRAQQRLGQFFDEVPCYVTVQDRDLKLIAVNRRFKEDFGDDVGGYCYECYKHRTEPCLECPVALTFEDGQSHESEEIVTSMGGDQYNVLVHTAPIRNEAGEITHVVEMSTNITAIRKLQSQLESTGLLIGSISHSIKGLLTGLDGGMYLVNSGLKSDNQERVKKGWEMVRRNVDRIRNTVLNILYYAKERQPHWEPIPIEDLANEVFSLMEPKALEHGVNLAKDVHGNSGELEGDRLGLRSMLVNLLENSLDACRVDKKKTDHQVTLAVNGEPDRVRFEVADNGIGMDRETKEKMFSLFFSSKGMEGTGLGLFIANNIAAAHGGSIDVESEVDRGTRFTVHLSRKRNIEQSDTRAE
ncbi:MAG: PAS domain-containing sensor histidine kinase [Candidatus Latescibacterota bacterium]|nr:MAG: PAS domain-containing sensor histidine kinase [Candidatus Latescibacterota bacterium]